MGHHSDLRILVVGHAYVDPKNRALWVRLAELYANVHIIVVAPTYHVNTGYATPIEFRPAAETRVRYEFTPLPHINSRFGRYVGLVDILKRFQPHTFHFTGNWHTWETIVAFLQSRLYSRATKCVGTSLNNIEYSHKYLAYLLREKIAIALCDAVLASDNASAAILKAHGYNKFVDVMYYPSVIPNHEVRPFKNPKDTLTVGFVGRLHPQKGAHLLLQALSQLNADWRLEIVGDGEVRTALEQLAQSLNINERTTFHGYIDRDRVQELMQHFDVLVLPSISQPNWREQFGVVLVEAMQLGIPIIGSSCGAIPEVVGNAGIIFPEGDIEALRKALHSLTVDITLRLRLMDNARNRFSSHYSADVYAERLYQLTCMLSQSPRAN